MTLRDPSADPSGTIEFSESSEFPTVIRFERRVAHPRDVVWGALVRPDAWLGSFAEPLAQGGTYRLAFHGSDMIGTVVELIPRQVLAITWSAAPVGPHETILRWELSDASDPDLADTAEHDGTVETVIAFTATTPRTARGPAFEPEGAAGWQWHDEALAASLDGDRLADAPAVWATLRDAYADRFAVSPSMGSLTAQPRAVVFRRLLRHPRDVVWTALTDPDRFATWLAPGDIDLRPGGAFRLDFGRDQATGTVRAVIVHELLEFTWSSPAAASSVIRWEISDGPGVGTWLVLTHRVDDEAAVAELLAGWHLHLDGLAAALAGADPTWPEGAFEPTLALYANQG